MSAAQELEDARRVYRHVDHGSSPFGLSYYGTYLDCGRKGALREADALVRLGAPVDEDDGSAGADNETLNMMKVGIYFHGFQEFSYAQGISAHDIIWPAELAGDVNFREAVRLFLGYAHNWGSVEARWGGRLIGAEVPLGEHDADAVKSILGGRFTGRADAIIDITDPDVARKNTGLILLPGRYLLDYKTSKAKTGSDEDKFGSRNLQAAGYLWLDNLEQPEGKGALGLLFDRCFLHKDLTPAKSYGAYVAWPQMDTEERLRALITAATLARTHALPNPQACKDFFGRECAYKRNGKCPGY